MVIGIDFDGTCVVHEYPFIGDDIGAVPVLQRLIDEGHRLVLFTMRGGVYLAEAVEWLEERGVELYGVNVNPTQKEWTDSPKAYCHLYIDDAALGCPLTNEHEGKTYAGEFVDWPAVERLLEERWILDAEDPAENAAETDGEADD